MGKQKEKPIKVYVRIRPFNKKEIQREEECAVETIHDDVERVKLIDHKSLYETAYRFDRVFGALDSNKTVFHFTTRDCLIKLLNGTNCSLIAYGETGSGKTYTLMENGGVTDYTISSLFKLMEADQMHSYKVSCSFVQVYVEKLYDILSANAKRELCVREHPSKGVYVQGLSEHFVSKEEHVFNLFTKGKVELIKARTEMHHLSSRSHSIFQITIQRTLATLKKKSKEEEHIHKFKIPQGLNVLAKEMVVCGKLDICDLAGSERLGKTLLDSVNHNEARYINSSLLHLGNVICALAEKKQRHIPFRNSTLTRLLQECLGSKCLTSFIICVSPSYNEIHETRCSLNFGNRARTITNRYRYFRRAINHEVLTKNLSAKIKLLEKRLLKTSAPIVCSDSHAQTEIEEGGHIDNANLYIGMAKHTLELSGVFDKCNRVLYNNTCRDENGHGVYSKAPLNSSKKYARLKLIISIATKHISDILVKLQGQLQTESYFKVMHDTKTRGQCTNTIGTVASTSNTESIMIETAFTLSKVCLHIRKNMEAIVKVIHNVPKVMQTEGPIETHAWYIHLNQFLNDLDNKEYISFKSLNFSCDFIYLFQLVQIVRLSLACSSRKSKSQKVKPIICSTPFGDGTISSSTPNTTLEYHNSTSLISSTRHYEKSRDIKVNWASKLNDFRKRNRQRENNMRKYFSSLPFLVDIEGKNSSRCHPKYTHEDNSREIEEARREEATYVNVVSRYNELHQKYVEAVEENDELFLKLEYLEQELEDNIQQPTYEEDRKMYYATRKDKEEELTQIAEGCSRYKLMVHNSDETLRKLSKDIMHLESRIDAQNNIMTKLEFEKNELIKQREENIEKNKGMQDIREDLKSFQDFFESRISLSEQILHLSGVVDDLKVKQNKGKFKDISELEQEVFHLLECNAHYEKALEDIRKKMTNYAHNIRDIEYKIRDHVINWNDDAKETLREGEDSKLTNATPLPNECDFKLSDLVISDDHAMQNIIVGDLHKSAEKNSSVIKDLKTCHLIKELLREKLKLIDKTERMKNTLKQVQDNIVRNKCKIDVFVKQLGQLDQQLNGVTQQTRQYSDNSRDTDCAESVFSGTDMELVEVSEMSYDNFNIFMQYFSNGETEKKEIDKEQKPNKNLQVIVDDELEELKSEVNYYKRKCKEMRSQSNELSDCLQEDLESTNKSLLCKIDYLKHTNTIIEKENKRAKKKSIEQRSELKNLKVENAKIAEQVKTSRFQSMQIEAKTEITRLQLEKNLSKYKAKNTYLEKYVKGLVDKEEEERNSFNDSGLPTEDLSDS